MKILLTNDDGIDAPGIKALAVALENIGDITLIAPDRERSAIGHALTLHHPLRATQTGNNSYAVDGTPTDCINLGIHCLMADKPDLVISGINNGGNLGDDITYSGTVSAAMEATLMGIPSFAVSLVTNGINSNYHVAAQFAAQLAMIVNNNGLPNDTFLNVNIPDIPSKQILSPVITTQGRRRYEGTIIDKIDPRGRNYYWIGSVEMNFLEIEGSDYHAVTNGHISITPLHLDFTNYNSISILKNWQFHWP
jgi:5'-nucleotidase